MEEITDFIVETINQMGAYGPILSSLVIVIESMVPIIPLFVFVSLNFLSLGRFWGFIVSYLSTMAGCLISFSLSRYICRNFFDKKFRKNPKVNKLMVRFDSIKLKTLSLIIAIPFTPAFLINIAAGLSKIDFKKYLFSIIIGKIFLVFFWGFVGTSLVESLKSPGKILIIILLVAASYFISSFVSKKLNID